MKKNSIIIEFRCLFVRVNIETSDNLSFTGDTVLSYFSKTISSIILSYYMNLHVFFFNTPHFYLLVFVIIF